MDTSKQKYKSPLPHSFPTAGFAHPARRCLGISWDVSRFPVLAPGPARVRIPLARVWAREVVVSCIFTQEGSISNFGIFGCSMGSLAEGDGELFQGPLEDVCHTPTPPPRPFSSLPANAPLCSAGQGRAGSSRECLISFDGPADATSTSSHGSLEDGWGVAILFLPVRSVFLFCLSLPPVLLSPFVSRAVRGRTPTRVR
jgi:hypothetical protein